MIAPGALVADGPRGGGRLRARARDPGQGRNRGRAVLDRRQPLGAVERGPLDRGARPRARGRRLPARHAARGWRPTRPRWSRSGSSAGVPVVAQRRAARAGRADRARRPRSAPATASGSSTTSRTGSSGSRSATSTRSRRRRSCCPPTRSSSGWWARSTRTSSSRRSTRSGPTSCTPGCGWSRCAPISTPTWTRPTRRSPATIGRQALQGLGPGRHPLLAQRRLRRAAGDVQRIRRAVLPGGLARVHRAVVAAVADGVAGQTRRPRVASWHGIQSSSDTRSGRASSGISAVGAQASPEAVGPDARDRRRHWRRADRRGRDRPEADYRRRRRPSAVAARRPHVAGKSLAQVVAASGRAPMLERRVVDSRPRGRL